MLAVNNLFIQRPSSGPEEPGIDLEVIDKSVKACQDFKEEFGVADTQVAVRIRASAVNSNPVLCDSLANPWQLE